MHAIALRCRRISRSGAQLDAALPVQTDQGGTTLHGTILWRLGAVCRGMADSVVVRVFVDGMDTALAEMTGSGFFCPHPTDGFFPRAAVPHQEWGGAAVLFFCFSRKASAMFSREMRSFLPPQYAGRLCLKPFCDIIQQSILLYGGWLKGAKNVQES